MTAKKSGGARTGAGKRTGPTPSGEPWRKQLNVRGPAELVDKIKDNDADNTEIVWYALYQVYGSNFERLGKVWQ